jgi:hypothetical protein
MIFNVNYQKRKNQELFLTLENKNTLFLSKTQNYVPVYDRFFTLTESNYKNVNLNHTWYLTSVKEKIYDEDNSYLGNVKNINSQKVKSKPLFFKYAPLLDPYKYLLGKYDITNPNLFALPSCEESEQSLVHSKMMDVNNAAYVDGLFVYLSSFLIHNNNFINGVDFYGSFLSIKQKYRINVEDDIEYLMKSPFFNEQKNKLFTVDEYEHLFQDDFDKKEPITIDKTASVNINADADVISDNLFEDVFDDNCLTLDNVKEMSLDLVDITHSTMDTSASNLTTTLKSGSSFSSRSSYTSTSENPNQEEENNDNVDDADEKVQKDKQEDDEESNADNDESNSGSGSSDGSNSGSSGSDEEELKATIKEFPVHVICMEKCENTLDSLILNDHFEDDNEWFASFMQIIMILITYQKVFSLTHNDLHTNNVMYCETKLKFVYYLYKGKYYKVPTHGRIFKIIDFGRSIYKFQNKLFCSDSFENKGDASSQYNTEPYFNDKKPRLEPNYSFDLCRLACSIFDYLVDDISDVKNLKKCTPLVRLIVEWCLDDKGVNLLYKNNGAERYPDFKLYKMIARCVHNHTPQAQLEREEFKQFLTTKKDISTENLVNIDAMIPHI